MRANLKEIEQHNHTAEVFVLLKGRSVLFVEPEGERLLAFDCQPGVIYNVPAGVWHTLLADKEATFLIVEERDTHLNDTHVRPITRVGSPQEIDARLPEWVDRWTGRALNVVSPASPFRSESAFFSSLM